MSFNKIDNIICFSHNYNEIFSNEIISILKECDTIYFNNYNNHEICIETKNLCDYRHIINWKQSIFNQPIDNLPNSISHLTLGRYFNQPIINLPNSITNLTLSLKYNKKINYFSDSLIINKI